MATTIFNPAQLIFATNLATDYAAPYFDHMQKMYNDATAVLMTMQVIVEKAKSNTKIIAAAIKTVDQIIACARIGIAAITIPATTFQNWLTEHPNTTQALASFYDSWQQVNDDLFDKL